MKKVLSVPRSLGLLAVVLLLIVAPTNAQEPDQDLTIWLKSRQFVPAPGMSKAIAAQLNVTTYTVQYHVTNILQKLHVGNRGEAVAAAVQRGLLRQVK